MAKTIARLGSKTLDAILRGTWQAKQLRLHDGGGLYLKANPTGGGYWSWRYMVDGKERELGIGSLGPVSAADARSKAQALRDQRRRGADPLAELLATETQARTVAAEQAASQLSFDAAAGQWIDGQIKAGKHSQTLANFHRWRAECQKAGIGSMVVRELKPSQIAAVVGPIYVERYETGKRMLNWIRNVIDLGFGDDDQTPNPADKGRMAKHIGHFKKGVAQNRAAMPWQQVPELVAKLWALPESPRAQALLMVILSGLRAVEVTRTEWQDEFNMAEACWTKPGAHMKMRREHFVPLSPAMLTVLDRMRPLRESRYVFPGLKAGEMIDENGMLKLLRDLGYHDATVHGFRSSISDWGGHVEPGSKDRRFADAVMKRVLAHGKNGEGVIGRYHRDNYYQARIEVMAAWAAHCLSALPADQRGHLRVAA